VRGGVFDEIVRSFEYAGISEWQGETGLCRQASLKLAEDVQVPCENELLSEGKYCRRPGICDVRGRCEIEMFIGAALQPARGKPQDGNAHRGTLVEDSLLLRDGGRVNVRAIRSDDTKRLSAFHRKLSPESIIFRFFHYVPELSLKEAERFTHVDYDDRMALVATAGEGDGEEILGVVRYDRIGPESAEVAFVVEDHWQGHGIATALLHRLAAYARDHGYTTFVALTMGNNIRMIEVLRNSGFPCTSHVQSGDVEVRLDITQVPEVH
jgi:RimJ/RimL family protein N-acetyltransferase